MSGADEGVEAVAAAAKLLASCRRLLVLTGAGSSADAGVPTFRDSDGLWRDHRPEDLASAAAFQRDPDLVWDWYRTRRLQVAGCQPHAGQRSLALLQRTRGPVQRVLVATTNEDDLLERAGVHPVVHLHGSLFTTRCAAGCGWAARDSADNGLSFLDCPRCGAPVRPGSTWFGEPLPPGAMLAIERFDADGCLVVGSSVLVQPVAAIPPEMAIDGRPVVEINPHRTPLSRIASISLDGTAKELLPLVVDHLTSQTVRDVASGLWGGSGARAD